MRIPDHLTCLLRNLHMGQEAIVRTKHGTTDWFKIGKGICQGCILSPCLFNIYAEYIMQKCWAGWIKTVGRNINSLRYADDTTSMAENEEELKGLLMKVKEESEKAGLELNIIKTKIMAFCPITSWQIKEEKVGSSDRFYFLGLQSHFGLWLQPWNLKDSCSWTESYDKLRQQIKNQRHRFADKGLGSQSYGFSSSCVRMWELDHKEGWAPKKCCFKLQC